PVSFIEYIGKVRKIVNKNKPKIIHTQAQVSFFIVALLMKFKLIPKTTKLIHTERGLYTKYSLSIQKVFFFFMKQLDVLVTTTEFNMNLWKTILLKKGYKMEYEIIENTAGELFEVYDSEKESKDDQSLVVGFAGRNASWKNWPLATKISKQLNEVIGKELKVKMAVGCLDKKSEIETKKMFDDMQKLLSKR